MPVRASCFFTKPRELLNRSLGTVDVTVVAEKGPAVLLVSRDYLPTGGAN